MIEILYPKLYVNSIYDIPYQELTKKNITGLIFDLDNTLAPFDIKKPDSRLVKFLNALTKEGFKICLVSNNNENRVKVFNAALHLDTVARAGKPRLKGIKKALRLIGKTPCEAAFIGDQVFTDVWCGNRMKIYTILVKPISIRDEFTVKLKRGIEKIVIKSYLSNRRSK